MSSENELVKCTKCEVIISQKFCPNCGNPRELQRINWQYVLSEFSNVFNLEKGIFYTLKEVILRPGSAVKKFLFEDRKRFVKPMVFIILCSIFFTFIKHTFNFDSPNILTNSYNWQKSTLGNIIFVILDNTGYSTIVMAFFIALWIKVFFRKADYNYYEIYTLLCYVMGIAILINGIFGILEDVFNFPVFQVGVNLGLIYISWGIARFFDKNKIVNYFKGIISVVLGMIVFIAFIGGIKRLIEWYI